MKSKTENLLLLPVATKRYNCTLLTFSEHYLQMEGHLLLTQLLNNTILEPSVAKNVPSVSLIMAILVGSGCSTAVELMPAEHNS